jgi:acetyl esterase/lipase
VTVAVTTAADLEYARIEGASLQLDLHRPDVEIPVPVVVYFHGGGFARGSRKDHAPERLLPIAAQGIAVASVSYRLTDIATHPAQVEDAKAAVAWLRENGAEHGLKTERIGAWGVSAGGWIALTLGFTATDAASSVQAVAAWSPPTDLTTIASEREAAGLPLPAFLQGRPAPAMEASLLGLASITDNLELVRDASPITCAAAATGPVLLVHGDRDGLVNSGQSLALHEALVNAGQDSQLLLLAGANHEDPAYHKPAVLGATAGFFSALL